MDLHEGSSESVLQTLSILKPVPSTDGAGFFKPSTGRAVRRWSKV